MRVVATAIESAARVMNERDMRVSLIMMGVAVRRQWGQALKI
jgi:hypothetical protein